MRTGNNSRAPFGAQIIDCPNGIDQMHFLGKSDAVFSSRHVEAGGRLLTSASRAFRLDTKVALKKI